MTGRLREFARAVLDELADPYGKERRLRREIARLEADLALAGRRIAQLEAEETESGS